LYLKRHYGVAEQLAHGKYEPEVIQMGMRLPDKFNQKTDEAISQKI
jgi:hypothetical protein